tara:strand:+ start:1312 stop:1623 length:312 start_codon:yes stop_codon:yes gene_type:complete
LKKERYEALKRVAAPGSGASDNERLIALMLMEQYKKKEEDKPPRISVDKGVSGKSLVVRRVDRKGACTVMLPIDSATARSFVSASLKLRLTPVEEDILCGKLN